MIIIDNEYQEQQINQEAQTISKYFSPMLSQCAKHKIYQKIFTQNKSYKDFVFTQYLNQITKYVHEELQNTPKQNIESNTIGNISILHDKINAQDIQNINIDHINNTETFIYNSIFDEAHAIIAMSEKEDIICITDNSMLISILTNIGNAYNTTHTRYIYDQQCMNFISILRYLQNKTNAIFLRETELFANDHDINTLSVMKFTNLKSIKCVLSQIQNCISYKIPKIFHDHENFSINNIHECYLLCKQIAYHAYYKPNFTTENKINILSAFDACHIKNKKIIFASMNNNAMQKPFVLLSNMAVPIQFNITAMYSQIAVNNDAINTRHVNVNGEAQIAHTIIRNTKEYTMQCDRKSHSENTQIEIFGKGKIANNMTLSSFNLLLNEPYAYYLKDIAHIKPDPLLYQLNHKRNLILQDIMNKDTNITALQSEQSNFLRSVWVSQYRNSIIEVIENHKNTTAIQTTHTWLFANEVQITDKVKGIENKEDIILFNIDDECSTAELRKAKNATIAFYFSYAQKVKKDLLICSIKNHYIDYAYVDTSAIKEFYANLVIPNETFAIDPDSKFQHKYQLACRKIIHI